MMKQKTIKAEAALEGIGMHSGDSVQLIVSPAPVNTGIIFQRSDCHQTINIPAQYDKVNDTLLCTALSIDSTRVATVEHILSAIAGIGIDNLYIKINASEVPIMDGSAAPFIDLFHKVGLVEQNDTKRYIRILSTIRVEEGDKYVQLSPYDGFKLTCSINFDHPVFKDKPQSMSIDLTEKTYIELVASARTFGFLSEYNYLKERNLAKGGSLENAIVVDENSILNPEGLRFDAEFVAHKLLDAIGDLRLLPYNIQGAFEGYKSGHALNNRLLHALMENEKAWELIT